MENNENTIPNVSVVFRELVHLSHTNPRLNNLQKQQYSQSSNNYYNSSNNNNRMDFVSNMGLDDRQRRHQQLMNKFKSSFQQNRQLLGINENSYSNNYLSQGNQRRDNGQYGGYYNNQQSYEGSRYGNNYNYLSSTNKTENQYLKTGQTKWMPPKIKYRHIEDKKQQQSGFLENNLNQRRVPQQQQQQVNQNSGYKSILPQYLEQQMRLRAQFYEKNQGSQLSTFSNTNNNNNKPAASNKQSQNKVSKNISVQNQQELQQQDQRMILQQEQQNFNKFSHLSQKTNTKYGQNLQSYWELCRKPVKNNLIQDKNRNQKERQSNADKFIRKQTPKVQGINLQKAMKILSIDD